MYTKDSKTRQAVIVNNGRRTYTTTAIAAFYNEPHPAPNLEAFIERLEAGRVLKKRGVTIRKLLEKNDGH